MRGVIWLTIFLIGLFGVIGPLYYLYVASSVPQLESEFDLERHLREYIEGERMSYRMGRYSKEKGGFTYEKPEFARLPKDMVAFYISGWGCPLFFQTPRETGFKWSWRVFSVTVFGIYLRGDGYCEWQLANELAWAIHIRGGLRQSIAASRIHAFLQKDQLVAYALSATPFDRAVVGLDDASQAIFKKPVTALRLEEMAELELSLPPNDFFPHLKVCKNPSLIRNARDKVLGKAAREGLIPEDRAKAAQAEAVACTRQ